MFVGKSTKTGYTVEYNAHSIKDDLFAISELYFDNPKIVSNLAYECFILRNTSDVLELYDVKQKGNDIIVTGISIAPIKPQGIYFISRSSSIDIHIYKKVIGLVPEKNIEPIFTKDDS